MGWWTILAIERLIRLAFLKSWLSKYWKIYCAALLGVILVLGSYLAWENYFYTAQEQIFEEKSSEVVQSIKATVFRDIESIEMLQAFFDASSNVDSNEFDIYTRKLIINHPSLEGVAWVPIVTAANKEAFLKNAQALYPGYTIKS